MTTKTMTKPRSARTNGQLRPWRTFFAASVLYFLLSLREMSQWTQPVWAVLVFLAVPIGMAFVLGRGASAGERVRASLWSVGLAMLLYTAINLMRLHAKIGSSGNAGGVFFAGLFVSVVYAVIAAGVSVAAGLVWDRLANGKGAR